MKLYKYSYQQRHRLVVLPFRVVQIWLIYCVLQIVVFVESSAVKVITIEGHLQYSNKVPYNITTPIVVNHGEYTTYSRTRDGNFTIHDVPPGVYLIEIQSPIHHFSQVKCLYKPHDDQSTPSSSSTINDDSVSRTKPELTCIEYYYPGATKRTIDESNMLVLTALASYEYFEKKHSFSILSILKNPMVFMMIAMAGMAYMLPKLMEGMDPEERAMMQKQMQAQQNPQQMLSSLLGIGGDTTNTNPTTATGHVAFPTTQSSATLSSPSTSKQSKKKRK
jgi:ER membrane protein complex subunit 7